MVDQGMQRYPSREREANWTREEAYGGVDRAKSDRGEQERRKKRKRAVAEHRQKEIKKEEKK